ncbi:MAG: YraN family protein [Sarcina sp.]
MKKYNKSIGTYGEDLATKFLVEKGYKIEKRNFHCKFGEVDLIIKKDDILAFVEVKSRFSSDFGRGFDSINFIKRKKIINVATYYLTITKSTNFFIRFDSIEINFFNNNLNYEITYLEDSFRI